LQRICLAGQTTGEQPKNDSLPATLSQRRHQYVDVDPRRTGQNGVNLEYTRTSPNTSALLVTPQLISTEILAVRAEYLYQQADQYFLLGACSLKRVRARHPAFRARVVRRLLFRGFTSDIRPSGNVYTFDDATSFAMAFGGVWTFSSISELI